jgi:subtilisin family serine protease
LAKAELQDRERKLAAAENLKRAEEALSRLAGEKVRCSLVYSYLGSIYSLQRKPNEMHAALRTALEMNPADRFANDALSRQGVLASKPVEVAASGALTRITSQVGLAPIRIIEALKEFDPRDTVSVGILSTGVDPSVPELKDRLWPGQSFVAQEPDILDRNGHGTNITTLFAAIAPTAKILPIKILSQLGGGQISDMVESIKFALNEDVSILLIPLGSSGKSAELEQIVARARKKRLILIAPAGNTPTQPTTYPAGLQGVISVGSTDAQDHRAPFSGFGKWVTLYAPAVNLEMIGVGGVAQKRSGESFAATVVARVAALVVATNPTLGPVDVENILIKTATDIASKNPTRTSGVRRVDALAALREAKSTRQ